MSENDTDVQGQVDSGKVVWLGELTKLEWKPGDVAVLMVPQHLPRAGVEELMHRWTQAMPGIKCIVLMDGIKLGVLSQADNV